MDHFEKEVWEVMSENDLEDEVAGYINFRIFSLGVTIESPEGLPNMSIL